MKKLKALFVCGAVLALGGTSCNQAKPMDDATILAKADSAATAQMQTVADEANKNCEANRAAWIMFKADSLYKAQSATMSATK